MEDIKEDTRSLDNISCSPIVWGFGASNEGLGPMDFGASLRF